MVFDRKAVMEQLIAATVKAGEMVKVAAVKHKKISHKGRVDLVTETDVAVEIMLKDELKGLIPESNFLAEESESDGSLGEFTWIIDPIDGTTNFAHGLPFVANSIALWHRDRIVLGVVNLPLLGEMFTAIEGDGAFLNGNPISVSSTVEMEKSLIATGFPYAIEEHLETVLAHLKVLLPLTQGIRRPGSAALDLAYVACGRYDGFYESALNPWDTAAGTLLVTEAGGRISEYDAATEYRLGARSILATNSRIHETLSGLLALD